MPVRSSAVTSPSHSNSFKIIYSAAVWHPDWSILSVQPLPHEELNRSITWAGLPPPLGFESSAPVKYFLRSKIFRQVTNYRSESPVHPSRGAACSAVVYCRWWDSQVEFRIVLEHLWKFFLNPRCTFIRAYNVHFNTYILAPVFIYFLLDSGGGKGSYHWDRYTRVTADRENWNRGERRRKNTSKQVYALCSFVQGLLLGHPIHAIQYHILFLPCRQPPLKKGNSQMESSVQDNPAAPSPCQMLEF